jgi:hypothetical protein
MPRRSTMSIDHAPNQALFPPVYQYRFCIKAIDTLVSEKLPSRVKGACVRRNNKMMISRRIIDDV